MHEAKLQDTSPTIDAGCTPETVSNKTLGDIDHEQPQSTNKNSAPDMLHECTTWDKFHRKQFERFIPYWGETNKSTNLHKGGDIGGT